MLMIYAILIVLGLCFGSFVNALVYRMRQNAKSKKKLSIWNGRSICPHCKHELSALNLIPVLSWAFLRGKCKYCKKPISKQYPLIELVTAMLFVVSYMFWPMEFNTQGTTLFVFWLVYIVGFVALSVYDFKWMILPNKIIYPMTVLASIQALLVVFVFDGGASKATEVLFSVLVSGGLFWLMFQASKGKWIGGGDVKLGFMLGLVLADPFYALLMLFVASLLGVFAVIPLVITKKYNKNTKIPFGPFLIMATIIVYLFGAGIINWYKTSFLLV
jgi:prepilin signal peptidase PulO-like enzyme (type II secretory pathway)